jgi:predicted transcriptional regulator
MYVSNLNSKQIRVYLNFLLDREFLGIARGPEQGSRLLYLTTQKGMRFIELYGAILELLAMEIRENVRLAI